MHNLDSNTTYNPAERSEYQIRMFERMVVVGCVAVVLLNIVHYLEGMYSLMALQLPILLLNVVNLFWLRTRRRIQSAVTIMLASVGVLIFGTTVHGGVEYAGALWLAAYPLLAFLLDGKRRGMYWTVMFNLGVITLFLAELSGVDLTPYSSAYLQMTVVSTMTTSILLYIYESLRQELVEALIESRQKAEAANVAKTNFLANMSHEIRTPMNGILGFSKILLNEELPAEARRHAEIIRTASTTLLGLIDDVLELSKIEADKITIEPEPTQLRELTEELVTLFRQGAEERGLSLELEYDDALPEWVSIDALRLRQVLINLLGNAMKFTPQGGITLRLQRQGSELRIELQDTGIGIPEDKLESIFAQFTQADNTLSRHYSGGGLGLSIVRRLVELMQGTIGVESKLDVGSCFIIRLPMQPVEAPFAEEAQPQSVPGRFAARVLVAEDDVINRMVVSRFLEDFGCQVECVENGRLAVEAMAQGGYDLLLMDLHMPQLDGISATREIRQSDPQTPIVALTADAMSSERDAALAAGMDDFLVKPLQQERLQQTLARFCNAA